MVHILVLGSGAREHIIATKFSQNKQIKKVYVCPGNDGMISKNIKTININPFSQEFIQFCKYVKIQLVFVGPETYLVNGIVDFLQSYEINCFGPRKDAALIEGCKYFLRIL